MKHDLHESLRGLERKHDVKIIGNVIYVHVGRNRVNDLGNGSHGRIDYLVKKHRYLKIEVGTFKGLR